MESSKESKRTDCVKEAQHSVISKSSAVWAAREERREGGEGWGMFRGLLQHTQWQLWFMWTAGPVLWAVGGSPHLLTSHALAHKTKAESQDNDQAKQAPTEVQRVQLLTHSQIHF